MSSCSLLGVSSRDAQRDEVMEKTNEVIEKDTDTMMEKDETAMEKYTDTMMVKEDVVVTEGDAMVKRDETMIQTSAGTYEEYSESAVSQALADGKKVALFFHAPWCPTCKAADTNLQKEAFPDNVVVFKTDYDTYTDLKKQYGVTYQHTFIALNADGSLLKKASGLSNVEEIVALF